MSDQYSLDLWVDSDPVSDDEREEVIMELVRDAGTEDKVKIGGRTRYLSEDPMMWVSLGTLAVASLDVFLHLLEYLESEENTKFGDATRPDGQPVHIETVDGDVVVNNGGEVIGELEVGVAFAADRDTYYEIMEKHYGGEEWERRQQEMLDDILERHGYEREE